MSKKDLFITYLENELGDESKTVLENINKPVKKTFRVNLIKDPNKTSLASLKLEGFEFSASKIENGYILEKSPVSKDLSRTKEVQDGKIYIQSLSSMEPILALNINAGDKVLDLCAAPGSKTSLAADLLHNLSEIVAIESNRSRFFKLENNLKGLGVTNTRLFNEDGVHFLKNRPEYTGYFDKVILDVPCSNEGNICFCDDSVERWNSKLAKKIQKLQKKLFYTAYKSLKSGGKISYSSCTYNKRETTDIKEWVLKTFKDLILINEKRFLRDETYSGFYFAIFESKDIASE